MNYSKFDRKECTLQYFLYKYVIGAWEFNKETGLVDVYGDYKRYKTFALVESEQIREEFNWERIAEIGLETIKVFFLRNH